MNPNNPLPGQNLSSQIYPDRKSNPTASPVTPAVTMPSVAPSGTVPTKPAQTTAQPMVPPPQISPISQNPIASSGQKPPLTPSAKSLKGVWIGLIIIVIVVIIGALAAYAYFAQLGPFSHPPYSTDSLASEIYSGFSNINTSSYDLHMNIVSQPKAADAKPFDLPADDSPEVQAYKQDLDTVRDLKIVLVDLQKNEFAHNNRFPVAMPPIDGVPASRLTSYNYSCISNCSDFSLSIAFQSADAVSALQKSAKTYSTSTSSAVVNGKTITFSNETASYINLPSQPPQPFLVNLLGMQKDLAYIPSDFELDGTFSGAGQKVSGNKVNSKVRMAGTAKFGDFNVAVDAQFEKVGDDLYFMLSKFPSLFGDMSKIKDKWIVFTSQDLATYGYGFMGSPSQKSQDEIAAAKDKLMKAIKIFLSVADKNHALTSIGSPSAEDVNGVRAYRYDLQFNKETMPQFYSDLTSQYQTAFTKDNPLVFDQATMDYLKSPRFSKAFDYFRANTTLTLWATGDGTPIRISYGLRMVPDNSSKNSDKQIMTTITLTLSDVNKPIDIQAPKDTMTIEDATIAMTGQSKESYEFSKQQSAVQSVRSALTDYKLVVGAYPETLIELTKTTAGLKGTVFTPRMTSIPRDVFTGKDFGYSKNGTDYELTYTMKFPPYVKGTTPASVYSYDYSNYSSSKRALIMIAVDGVNTANYTVASKEAVTQSKIDSDGDGLPDVLERYIGTDPNKKDTDGDGYSDYDELIQGSNPLGPGNLTGSRYGGGSIMY